jgi:RNA polymerase primary sigma factor
MSAEFRFHEVVGPAPVSAELTGLAPRPSGTTGPSSPWQCPVPTLDGVPRLQPAPLKSAEETAGFPAGGIWPIPLPAASFAGQDKDDFLLRLYLRDALREPRLTAAQEIELGWLSTFDDDSARERLVLGNLRLVVHLAFAFRRPGLPVCDLINEGNIGLMRAAELFNPAYGRRFASYAAPWVRQRLNRALSRHAWPVRLPTDFAFQQKRLRSARARLANESGREPAPAELAAGTGFAPATVRRLSTTSFPECVALQSPLAGGEEGQTLADVLPDERTLPPDQALVCRDEGELVTDLLASLKPREGQVLRLRFGLDDGCERSLEEVGRSLGYVRQGIHRIESAALAKLRRKVQTFGFERQIGQRSAAGVSSPL